MTDQESEATPPARKPYPYGVHALVLGLIACAAYPFAVVLGPIAVISGVIGHRAARKRGGVGEKLALAGILLGVVSLVLFFGKVSGRL